MTRRKKTRKKEVEEATNERIDRVIEPTTRQQQANDESNRLTKRKRKLDPTFEEADAYNYV